MNRIVTTELRCTVISVNRFTSNSYWLIFFKLCMDIDDIREEWFGIANGLNLFINNRVMALDWCKNVFFLNIFRRNGWILIKFCVCIDYKIRVVSNARYFWSVFNKSCGPWLMSEVCLCSIFCELICRFGSNFVYALILTHILTRCRFGWLTNIFRSFSTELWPLIVVEISFMLNTLWTNQWILIQFWMHWYWQNVDKDNYKLFFGVFQLSYGPWLVRILFLFNILRTNWWILMKFCLPTIVTNTWNFPNLFNRVMALDWC